MQLIPNTRILSGKIEEIIQYNEDVLYIVSPYIQLDKGGEGWKHITEALDEQIKNNHEIIFFLRKPKRYNDDFRELLKQLRKYASQIWLIPHLHSKCYYNGKKALLSSMNFYLHSSQNNLEIGVEFTLKDDPDDMKIIEKYILKLKGKGEEVSSEEIKPKTVDIKKKLAKKYPIKVEVSYKGKYSDAHFSSPDQEHIGFCISCGKSLKEFDVFLDHVRCYDCFQESKYEDEIEGKFCHCCGFEQETSLKKPACYECYRQIKLDVIPINLF